MSKAKRDKNLVAKFATYQCTSLGGCVKWGMGPCAVLSCGGSSVCRQILINVPENLQRVMFDWSVPWRRAEQSDIIITKLDPEHIGGLPGFLMGVEMERSVKTGCEEECHVVIKDDVCTGWCDVPPENLPISLKGSVRVVERFCTKGRNSVIRIWGPEGIISFIQEMAISFTGSNLLNLDLQVVEILSNEKERNSSITIDSNKRRRLNDGSICNINQESEPELSALILSRPRGEYINMTYPDKNDMVLRSSLAPPTLMIGLVNNDFLEVWCTHDPSEGKLDVQKCNNMGVIGPHMKLRKNLCQNESVEIDGRTIYPADVLSGGRDGPQWIITDAPTLEDSYFIRIGSKCPFIQELLKCETINFAQPVDEKVENILQLNCNVESPLSKYEAYLKKYSQISIKNRYMALNNIYSKRITIPCLRARKLEDSFKSNLKLQTSTDVPSDIILEAMDMIDLGFNDNNSIKRFGDTKDRDMIVLNDNLEIDTTPIPNDPPFKPKLIFGGTSSSCPTRTRNVTSIFIEHIKNQFIVLDCGEGTLSQFLIHVGGKVNRLRNIHSLVLSHAHADHFNGIPLLIEKRRMAFEADNVEVEPLKIYCTNRFKVIFDTWRRAFKGVMIEGFDYKLIFINNFVKSSKSLEECQITLDHDVKLATCLNHHISESVAMRIDFNIQEKDYSVVFSGDTGWEGENNIIELSTGCNMIIHEATFTDDMETMARMKAHSTREQAIRTSIKSKSHHLILTHFSARDSNLRPEIDDSSLEGFRKALGAEKCSKKGLKISWGDNDMTVDPSTSTIDFASDHAVYYIPEIVPQNRNTIVNPLL